MTQPGHRPRVWAVATLRVTLEPLTRERVAPGDAAVQATVVNEGAQPEPFHEHQARHGTTLLLITHDPSVAERCERLIRLLDGKIIEDRRAAPVRVSTARRAR